MGGKGSGRPEPASRGAGGKYVKEGCFVATAVYGDHDAPQVARLRQFRDETLRRTVPGRMFVYVYYRFSPPIARVLLRTPKISARVRVLIDAFIYRYLSRKM